MPSMDVITPKSHSDESKATASKQMAPVAKTTGELNSKVNQIEGDVGFRVGLEGIVKLVQHPGMQDVLDQYAPKDKSRDIGNNPYLIMLAFLKLVDLTTNQTGPLLFKQMMVLNAMLNTQPARFDTVTVHKIHCDTSGIFNDPNNSSEQTTDYNLMPIFMAIHLKY